MQATREQWKGSQPVFLLSIEWNGRTFRASTEPILIPSSEGVDVQFHGGLVEDPDFSFELPDLGFQVSSYSTPIAVYLCDIDVAQQYSRQNTLENAKCELDYILVKEGQIQNYEERINLVHGIAKQPIYGHRDKAKSYVEFSIETPTVESSALPLSVGANQIIDAISLSALLNTSISPFNTIFKGSTTTIDVIDVHKGKNLPLIIGQSGFYFDETGTKKYFGATPAYVIHAISGSTNKIFLAIAGHEVDCERVYIFDDLGNFRLENVDSFISRTGDVFSFVEFTHGSGGFQNPIDDENSKYFVSWFDGGGMRSPLTNAPVSGAGDLCLYLLSLGDNEVDFAAWYTVSTYLNRYKFAGAINSVEVTPLEFLENEIIPFLPISVIQGVEGIKPVLNLLSDAKFEAKGDLIASSEFVMTSGVSTIGDSSRVINEYTLEYAYDMHQDQYRKTITISGNTENLYQDKTASQQVVQSLLKYGSRPKKEQSNYIHDEDTASFVCFDKIRFNSTPYQTITYQASPRFGYLEVGDIYKLTDTEANIENQICQVIMLAWEDTNWSVTLKIAPEGY
tara:strand:+ start:801 stop:2495 length:1695 start_codon:yes stop_codon:yes gene_type:complete